jgi:hypothetical protein
MYDPDLRPDEVILVDEYTDREKRMNPDPLHVQEEEPEAVSRQLRIMFALGALGTLFIVLLAAVFVVGLRHG